MRAPRAFVVLHRRVGGHFDLAAGAFAQSGFAHPQLAVAEPDAAGLAAPADDIAGAFLAWLGEFSTGNLLRRQFQHGLDGGAAGDVNDLVDGSAALLDQFNQGQHELRVLAEQASEIVGADWLLLCGI